jgi:preprotein translocase subunit YajC
MEHLKPTTKVLASDGFIDEIDEISEGDEEITVVFAKSETLTNRKRFIRKMSLS